MICSHKHMFAKVLRSKWWNIGLGDTFNLSYHMINSDGKSQSYNSKYAILSHNVLISYDQFGSLSKLLGQRRWNIGLGDTFNLSYHMINSDRKSQSYNSKYAILSHNVLICLSKILGQKIKCRTWQGLWFKLKITILAASVQKLWPKMHFHEMSENIMYP